MYDLVQMPPDSNAVQKVCAILRALAASEPQRLSPLSAATGLNKVTALRILDTLVQEGFVERVAGGPASRPTYRLGREALIVGATRRADGLGDLVRPSLVRLAAWSEDTVLLSVRSGIEAVCLDRQVGCFPIRANYLDVGSRRPLGVGAGSLALLAWLPDREVDAILGAIESRLGPYPRMALGTIRAEIEAARARGYVLLLDRIVDRMGAIGVPVRDPEGGTVAALSIAALSERIRDREGQLAGELLREADLVFRELASSRPAPVPRLSRRRVLP